MAAQCPPDISGRRVGGCLRKPEHIGRTDDVDLAPVAQVLDGTQRPGARLLDCGHVRNEIELALGTGDSDVEQAEPARLPAGTLQRAARDPASFPSVLDKIKDNRVEFAALGTGARYRPRFADWRRID